MIVFFDKLLISFYYFVGILISFIIVCFMGMFDDLCLFGIVWNNKLGIYGYIVFFYFVVGL